MRQKMVPDPSKSSPAVVLVTPKYPPVPSGYGNQAFSVNRILKKRIRMHLLTVDTSPQSIFEAHEIASSVRHVPQNYSTGKIAVWTLKSVYWMFRNARKYDVVHILGGYFWSIPFILAGHLLGKPTVVKIISGELDLSNRNAVLRRCRVRLLQLATRVIVLNEYTRRLAINMGFQSSRVLRIPNGVDTKRFSRNELQRRSFRAELGISEECFVVLTVGQIGVRKGVDRLLLAWEEFYRKNNLPSLLLLVGKVDGSIPQERFTTAKGIKLIGHVDDPWPYYNIADCFVLLSRSEGMANVILEAVAMGLPFIVSDIPPNQELASLLGGRVASGTDKEIAIEAATHLRDIGKAHSSGGFSEINDRVRREFSLEAVARRYGLLYKEIST